jgi:hypothetical protein
VSASARGEAEDRKKRRKLHPEKEEKKEEHLNTQ